jgi:hypothetical protein
MKTKKWQKKMAKDITGPGLFPNKNVALKGIKFASEFTGLVSSLMSLDYPKIKEK